MKPRSLIFLAMFAICAPAANAEVIGADARHSMSVSNSAEWLEKSRRLALEVYQNDYVVTSDVEDMYKHRAFAMSGEKRLQALNYIIRGDLALGYEVKALPLLANYDALAAKENNERHQKASRSLHAYRKALEGAYKTAAVEISAAMTGETDPYVIATASTLGAYAWTDSGYPGKAFELIRHGRAAAESLDDNAEVLASVHEAWSYASLAAGDFESSIAQTAIALELSVKARVPVDGVSILYNLALTASDQGEYPAAREFATMEAELAARTGIAEEAFYAAYLCAVIGEASGEFDTSERCAREAVASPAAVEDFLPSAKGMLVTALAKRGEAGEARSLLEEIRAGLDPEAAPRDAVSVRALEAQVRFAEGDAAGAMKEYEDYHRAFRKISEANFNDGVRELRAGLEDDLEAERVRAAAAAKEASFMSERVRLQELLLALSVVLFIAALLSLASHRRNSRKLKEAMQAAEAANRAKSDFLASMSHELRTPMNGVLGMAQSLAGENLTSDQKAKVATILDSGATLLSLLNDVLDLSKIEAGHMEISSVDGDFEQVLLRAVDLFRPLAAERGNRIEFEYPADAPKWMNFDPVRVRQCVSNLVSNAVKFTENGVIRVEASVDMADDRLPVLISVSDTGIGMSPETVANLFKPYSQGDASITRRYGGTGLGLAIARRIARLMDGDIAAESVEGEGTTMKLSFVLQKAQVAAVEPAATVPASTGSAQQLLSGKRVLIVDDVLVNRQVARLFLKPLGAVIEETASGAGALAYLAENDVDIILLDIQMPELDGFETARRIRRLNSANAGAVIIALTAGVTDGEEDRCLDAGMDGFALKPLDIRALASVIATAQEHRRQKSRAAA